MTVIAYDGKTLATDRQACASGIRFEYSKWRTFKGNVMIAAGSRSAGLILMNLYQKGTLFAEWPESQTPEAFALLVVGRRDGSVEWFDYNPVTLDVTEGNYAAWGSGREVALGAMWMKGTARQAVMAANAYCTDCGFGVDSFAWTKKRGWTLE